MNKKQLIVAWVMGVLLLNGCATVNFSANYYTPPENYRKEVEGLWNEFLSRIETKYDYDMAIVSERECKMGIPEINKGFVKIPDNYIKYVYQNYYSDRFKILLVTYAHEICHMEYALYDQSTPAVHFKVDQQATGMLNNITVCTSEDYYKSYFVLRNYWFARKGVAGHTFNIGWNLLQVASLAYGGAASFADWFATDIDGRLDLMSKQYNISPRSCFSRSQKDNKSNYCQKDIEIIFKIQKIRQYDPNERQKRMIAWASVKARMTESQVKETLSEPEMVVSQGSQGGSQLVVWHYQGGSQFVVWYYKDGEITFWSNEGQPYKVLTIVSNYRR